jgi:hypothetical protein
MKLLDNLWLLVVTGEQSLGDPQRVLENAAFNACDAGN